MIAEKAEMADNFYKRLIGLTDRSVLAESEALILTPCNSIHTFGMKFMIDVVFLDSELKICHFISNMKKYRISAIMLSAKYVVELHAGLIDRLNIQMGDQIILSKDPY